MRSDTTRSLASPFKSLEHAQRHILMKDRHSKGTDSS